MAIIFMGLPPYVLFERSFRTTKTQSKIPWASNTRAETAFKKLLDRLMLAAGCGVNQLRHKVGGALCTLRRSGGMEEARRIPSASIQAAMISFTPSPSWTQRRLPVFRHWTLWK